MVGIMTRTVGYRERKGWILSEKPNKMFGFCWNCLKSDFLTRLRGFEWFLIFFILFNPFSNWKFEKLDFQDSNNSTSFKQQLLENHKCEVYQPEYY